MQNKKELNYRWFCLLFSKSQLKMSFIISCIVGTILNLINQGDLLTAPEKINILNAILTYCVPFCVSLLSSTLVALKHQKKTSKVNEQYREEQHKVFFNSIDSSIQNITPRLSNDPNFLPENLALFVKQLEEIEKLKLANNSMKFNRVKEVINTGDLPKAFSIIVDLVGTLRNENIQGFMTCKQELETLCNQRQKILDALNTLEK